MNLKRKCALFLIACSSSTTLISCGTDEPLSHETHGLDMGRLEDENIVGGEESNEPPAAFEEPQPGWVLLDKFGERVILSNTFPSPYPGERLEGYTFDDPIPPTAYEQGLCFYAGGAQEGPLTFVNRYDLGTGRPEPCYGDFEGENIPATYSDETCGELVHVTFGKPSLYGEGYTWKKDGQFMGLEAGGAYEEDGYFTLLTDTEGVPTCRYIAASQLGYEKVFVKSYKPIPEVFLGRFEGGAPYRLVWK